MLIFVFLFTSDASFSEEFLFYSWYWFGSQLSTALFQRSTVIGLERSFDWTPDASFSEEFLTLLMLVLLRSVACTPSYSFSEECLLHSWSSLYWGGSLALLVIVLASFQNTPDASFSEECLLHSWCWFSLQLSTGLIQRSTVIGLERSFDCTPDASFSEEFSLHSWL